ncbi:outer membrane receptor protein involved in Fe transport [Nitrospirillum amazonense]|uniref:Outer membrane receptor protein involved in Fe transport n=1 Tax=Nitrospirillum amazonense TaxID=28077 RepID=A0A560EUR4_9PROT|nr:TonB-dependent receptor [Nitrospirillum amazonense]TWB13068.1 outer membrane receptor protein involved in Fe transport [Nitrospirillum amazonense]
MKRGTRAFLCAGVATLAISAGARAQQAPDAGSPTAAPADAADMLAEIVVTAQKRVERLIDVPQSVSAVSAEALQQAHADRLDDFFTRVPSAALVETQAGQARLILRGINTGGVGATVATYVDETPYGSATSLANGAILTPDLDPSDLERVEVLRGPQGTLYGANSLGGLVKYVTVAPSTDAVHAAAELSTEDVAHGDTGWSGRASVNVPLADTLAVRASGFYRRDPGFIDDQHEKDINDGRTYGGRVSALFKPTDALSLRASVVLQNLDSNGTNQVDVDPLTLKPVLGDYRQARVVAQPSDMQYRVYNLTGSYDFGPVQLLSSTSYSSLYQNALEDASGLYGDLLTGAFGVPLGASQVQQVQQRRLTEEVRLASTDTGWLEWTVGGFYTRERNAINQIIDGVDGASGAHIADFSGLALANLASRYEEYAGFASGTVHLNDQFDLTFGGRYSHNEQDAVQVSSGPLAGDSDYTAHSSDGVFTYSVAPSFKPNEDTTIYVRVAKGYRPGGPNVLPPGAPDAVPHQFGADTTTNYEIGVKSELLNRKLSLELTGFYIDWDNIQLFSSVDDYGVNINGGTARSQGIEASVTMQPLTGLTVSLNGAFVDATLTSDAPPLVGGLKGDRLPYTARFSSTLAVEYQRPLSETVDGIAGFSWRYTGDRLSAFDTSYGQRHLSAYSQVDAHAGVTFGAYRIDAFVRNLTDSRGILDVGAAGSALDGNVTAAIVRPRSFGATLGYRF